MSTDHDQGLRMRVQALALLQQAAAMDRLKPYAVTHRHEHGSSTYLLWSHDVPSEAQAAAVLEADYEPEKGESLDIETLFSLEEICGIAPSSRLDEIAGSSEDENARKAGG